MAVDLFALVTIHAMLHPVGVVGAVVFVEDEGYLPAVAFAMLGGRWIFHAACFYVAVPALQ